jgi:hypothetical protein
LFQGRAPLYKLVPTFQYFQDNFAIAIEYQAAFLDLPDWPRVRGAPCWLSVFVLIHFLVPPC